MRAELNWANHVLLVQTVYLVATCLYFTLDNQLHHC